MGVAAQRLTRERKGREDAILEAARRLFRERGVIGTTMDGIAAASEVSKPTIYAHFHSKNDIVCCILRRRLAHLNDLLADLALPTEPQERLAEIGNVVIRYVADPDHISDLSFPIEADFRLTDLARDVREGLETELGRSFSLLGGVLAEGERAGVFVEGWDARRLATIAWGTLVGISALAKRFHPDLLTDSSEAVFAELLAIVVQGVTRTGPKDTGEGSW